MATIFLSGVGGSSNWLPFILPLIAIAGIIKSAELIIRYIKKRKLIRHGNISSHAGPDFMDTPGQSFEDNR